MTLSLGLFLSTTFPSTLPPDGNLDYFVTTAAEDRATLGSDPSAAAVAKRHGRCH
jgi:hypothetical protein